MCLKTHNRLPNFFQLGSEPRLWRFRLKDQKLMTNSEKRGASTQMKWNKTILPLRSRTESTQCSLEFMFKTWCTSSPMLILIINLLCCRSCASSKMSKVKKTLFTLEAQEHPLIWRFLVPYWQMFTALECVLNSVSLPANKEHFTPYFIRRILKCACAYAYYDNCPGHSNTESACQQVQARHGLSNFSSPIASVHTVSDFQDF